MRSTRPADPRLHVQLELAVQREAGMPSVPASSRHAGAMQPAIIFNITSYEAR